MKNWTVKKLRSGKFAVVWCGKNILITNRYGDKDDEKRATLAAAAPELFGCLETLSSEINAIMCGEHGHDWADHFGPLFDMLYEAEQIISKIRKE